MGKTSVKPEENVTETKVTYPKAKLLTFKRYANRTDLLGALLLDEAEYTMEEVDELINNFMKG